ncbi:MAG: peptidoglycan-binding protein [Candidatus Paceibacterota bacterium]|jgi:peptidoglycan hydrolase-like protein with peptidoglycan-binding domain
MKTHAIHIPQVYSAGVIALITVLALMIVSPAFAREDGSEGSGGEVSNPGSSERNHFEKNLGFGIKDDEVARLQKELQDEGFFDKNIIITGNFMDLTKKAVVEFQKAHGIPATGFVGELTRKELNKALVDSNEEAITKPIAAPEEQAQAQEEVAQTPAADATKKIQELTAKIKELEAKIKSLMAFGQTETARADVTPEAQARAGVIITGGVSGPGYPTGPLNIALPATQLLFDRVGQVGQGQVKDRQYEAPLETIPPTMGAFPITINGVANTATQLKVITNLKTKNGVGQHQGTIDIDIDTIPAGHVTLAYNGTATVVGSTITSKGTFKTAKTTGIFAGLVAEGTYEMTIVESAQVPGAPVTVSITTVSP